MQPDGGCWIETEDGIRVRVGRGGLAIGREVDCQIALLDERVSRHHALVRMGPGEMVLDHRGSNPTLVDGAPVARSVQLCDGNVLTIGGHTLRVVQAAHCRPAVAGWMLRRADRPDARGVLFGVGAGPTTLGGDPDDDLWVPGLPPGALCFQVTQGALSVEARHRVRINGAVVDEDADSPLEPGDRVAIPVVSPDDASAGTADEVELEVMTRQVGGGAPTLPLSAAPLPSAVQLQHLPRGGRIWLTFGAETVDVYLSERRFDMVHTLLHPPEGGAPGAVVDDAEMCARVWPRSPEKGREHVNLLLLHLRRTFMKRGVFPFRILEREGGGTRFNLAPGGTFRDR